MKRGISVTRDYDYHNTPCVVITKKRGKLTIPEITDILHYEDQQRWSGRYALLLDCTEVTMGGNGCLDMMDERPGDAVVLYELEEGEPCPVCNASLPPFQYCPTCGSAWAENGTNIETHLADMQQEASRSIKNPDASEASRLAWYWSHIGSIDLARQLGLISEKRRQELYEEMRPLKPAITVPVDTEGVNRNE